MGFGRQFVVLGGMFGLSDCVVEKVKDCEFLCCCVVHMFLRCCFVHVVGSQSRICTVALPVLARQWRGKHDCWNGTLAGVFTGGALAIRGNFGACMASEFQACALAWAGRACTVAYSCCGFQR